MFLSLVRERDPSEARVALTPEGVHGLVEAGHEVVVETEAGQRAGFLDSDYRAAGAQIAFSDFEAVRLSQVWSRSKPPPTRSWSSSPQTPPWSPSCTWLRESKACYNACSARARPLSPWSSSKTNIHYFLSN